MNIGGSDLHGAAVALDFATERAENLQHVVGVGDIGDAFNDDLLIGQKSSCENGERGVFGTGNIDRSGEGGAAVHEKFVHGPLLLGGGELGFLSLPCKWKAGDSTEIRFNRDLAQSGIVEKSGDDFTLIVSDFERNDAPGI